MRPKGGFVYIVANYSRTVLYTGVTSQLRQRSYHHRNEMGCQFTTKYGCKYLMYYEFHDSIEGAIIREKQIKRWKREWKINLIKSINPNMEDLYFKVDAMD